MFSRRIKKLEPLEGYNLWSQTYAKEENPIKRYSDELITNWLEDLKGKSVLDVGCGTGKFCQSANERGALKVFGADLSPKMIEEAKKNCEGATLKVLDLTKEKIEGKFDVIVCALVLGHLANLDFALTHLINNLEVGGILLVTDFHPFQTLKGAKRTFKNNKKEDIEVEHHLHFFEEYFKILSRADAFVDELIEPKWRDEPVVFGMKIRKRS